MSKFEGTWDELVERVAEFQDHNITVPYTKIELDVTDKYKELTWLTEDNNNHNESTLMKLENVTELYFHQTKQLRLLETEHEYHYLVLLYKIPFLNVIEEHGRQSKVHAVRTKLNKIRKEVDGQIDKVLNHDRFLWASVDIGDTTSKQEKRNEAIFKILGELAEFDYPTLADVLERQVAKFYETQVLTNKLDARIAQEKKQVLDFELRQLVLNDHPTATMTTNTCVQSFDSFKPSFITLADLFGSRGPPPLPSHATPEDINYWNQLFTPTADVQQYKPPTSTSTTTTTTTTTSNANAQPERGRSRGRSKQRTTRSTSKSAGRSKSRGRSVGRTEEDGTQQATRAARSKSRGRSVGRNEPENPQNARGARSKSRGRSVGRNEPEIQQNARGARSKSRTREPETTDGSTSEEATQTTRGRSRGRSVGRNAPEISQHPRGARSKSRTREADTTDGSTSEEATQTTRGRSRGRSVGRNEPQIPQNARGARSKSRTREPETTDASTSEEAAQTTRGRSRGRAERSTSVGRQAAAPTTNTNTNTRGRSRGRTPSTEPTTNQNETRPSTTQTQTTTTTRRSRSRGRANANGADTSSATRQQRQTTTNTPRRFSKTAAHPANRRPNNPSQTGTDASGEEESQNTGSEDVNMDTSNDATFEGQDFSADQQNSRTGITRMNTYDLGTVDATRITPESDDESETTNNNTTTTTKRTQANELLNPKKEREIDPRDEEILDLNAPADEEEPEPKRIKTEIKQETAT